MKVEFQRKGCEKKVYEASSWLDVLWFVTDAMDGDFDLSTVEEIESREYAEVVEGLGEQDKDLAVMEWYRDNGNHYFVGVEGVTFEDLMENRKEEFARLLCLNKDFLQALSLHCLKIDDEYILSWCKPKNSLMYDELRVF